MRQNRTDKQASNRSKMDRTEGGMSDSGSSGSSERMRNRESSPSSDDLGTSSDRAMFSDRTSSESRSGSSSSERGIGSSEERNSGSGSARAATAAASATASSTRNSANRSSCRNADARSRSADMAAPNTRGPHRADRRRQDERRRQFRPRSAGRRHRQTKIRNQSGKRGRPADSVRRRSHRRSSNPEIAGSASRNPTLWGYSDVQPISKRDEHTARGRQMRSRAVPYRNPTREQAQSKIAAQPDRLQDASGAADQPLPDAPTDVIQRPLFHQRQAFV